MSTMPHSVARAIKPSIHSIFLSLWSHKEILCLIGIWLLLRLIRFSQNVQFDHPDFMSDYLTSRHIVAFGEYQYVGQGNSVFTTVPNSPFYNYFLAAILFFHDSMWTLVYANLLLQLIAFICMYGLARLLFGKSVGLLTGAFLAVNQASHNQIHYLWLPTAAQPFFYLSYFFFAAGYCKKNIAYLYSSVCFFIIAMGIGLYGFALLPCFLIGLYLNAKHARAKTIHLFTLPALTILLIAAVYAPVLSYIYQTHQLSFLLNPQPYITTFSMFFMQFLENIRLLLAEIFVPTAPKPLMIIGALMLLFQGYVYMRKKAKTTQILYVKTITVTTLSVLIFASLLTSNRSYHFIMITGPVIILLCELVYAQWTKKWKISLFFGVLTTILFITSAMQPSYLQYIWNKPSIYDQMQEAITAMMPTLDEIKHTYGSTWPNHFQIITYSSQTHSNPAQDIFWAMLEEKTHTKLTKRATLKTLGHNFIPLGTHTDYLIVVCSPHKPISVSQEICAAKLKNDYPNHAIIKPIYEGGVYQIYNIFLARRS